MPQNSKPFPVILYDRADIDNKTVVIDYIGLKEKNVKLWEYNLSQGKSFRGDRDIFTRIPEVNLYVLRPVERGIKQ